MNYSKELIEQVTNWIAMHSTAAYNFLLEKNAKEWVLCVEAIFVSDASLEKLVKTKQIYLAAFVKAIEGENNSIKFLLQNKAAHLAATANLVNRDMNAEAWLKKNNMNHYVKLAEAIREKLEKSAESDLKYLFKGPF